MKSVIKNNSVLFVLLIVALAYMLFVGLHASNNSSVEKATSNIEIDTPSADKAYEMIMTKAKAEDTSSALILFFATWCKYCVDEFPEFVEMSKNVKNMDIFLISLDRNSKDIQRFLSKYDVSHIKRLSILPRPSSALEELKIKLRNSNCMFTGKIPHMVVIDKSKKQILLETSKPHVMETFLKKNYY